VKGIVNFFNSRGTAKQWIKEGRYALDWARLPCHKFVVNQGRLLLFILAYNLGNFFKMLALPEAMKRWSLRSVQTKLMKTSRRLVRHARKLVFQLAEIMVTMKMCGEMLEMIGSLRPVPSQRGASIKVIVVISKLPWARCGTCRVRSGLRDRCRFFGG